MPFDPPINWAGRTVTTDVNPYHLAPLNKSRVGWRAYNLSGATGKIGYNNILSQAYIPMPVDSSYPVGSSQDAPVESNDLWYHGPVGSVIGFAEA